MVAGNQEPESGGKEGILAIIAIAVVLFFVIRIYADYVTKTGQAVKPGHEAAEPSRQAPEHPLPGRSDSVDEEDSSSNHGREKPGRSADFDEPLADGKVPDRPRKPEYSDDEIPAEPQTRRDAIPTPNDEPVVPGARDRANESTASDEAIAPVRPHRTPRTAPFDEAIAPVRPYRTPRRTYARDIGAGGPRYHYSRTPYSGQIVIGHEPIAPHRGSIASNRAPYDEILPSRPHNHVSRRPYAGQIVIGHAPGTRTTYAPTPDDARVGGTARYHSSRRPYAGQIVIRHALDSGPESGFGQTIAHRRSLSGVQKPRLIDQTDRTSLASDRSDSTAPIAGAALFSSAAPYPGTFDDVQIGDRMSEVGELDLPQGRLSHSVYIYNPANGPFKTVSAIFGAGPADPAVTRVVYRFRNAKCRAEVRRQALDAFGDGDIVDSDRGECRQWRHVDGLTVTLEHDRYCIERAGSNGTPHAARHFGRTVME